MPLYICFEARSGKLLWYGEGAPKFYSKNWKRVMDQHGILILTTPGHVQGLGFDPQLIVDADHDDARREVARYLKFPVEVEAEDPSVDEDPDSRGDSGIVTKSRFSKQHVLNMVESAMGRTTDPTAIANLAQAWVALVNQKK
jgi:hypothetical protein